MPAAPSIPTSTPLETASPWRRAVRVTSAYIALTKPRIIELLLVTTVPAMVLAAGGWPSWTLVITTLIGGSLSSGAAHTFNSYLDRDIDAVMSRTRKRPLVTGEASARGALIFAWVLTAVSTAWFWWVVDSPLATAFSVAAIAMYVVGYTMVLKRRTPQNIVWGGAAGCMPVLIGWSAVTNSVSWAPFMLFLVVFFWTPPHYWPLAMRYQDDYAKAQVPMLPLVAPTTTVTRQMVWYAVAMVAASAAVAFFEPMTWAYLAVVIGAGAWFVNGCASLHRRALADAPALREMRVFRDSILYLTVVFAAVLVDPFLPTAWGAW